MAATGKDSAGAISSPSAVAGKGNVHAWLPLGVAILVMPALAFATTNWLLLPKLRQELGLTGAAKAAESHGGEKGEKPSGEASGHGSNAATKGPKETVQITKLIVNVANTMGSRFLLVGLSVVGSGAEFKSKVEGRDAQLRDTACGILSTKTLADLEKPGARNLIRSELQNAFNTVLGDSSVQEIYFTEFAVQ